MPAQHVKTTSDVHTERVDVVRMVLTISHLVFEPKLIPDTLQGCAGGQNGKHRLFHLQSVGEAFIFNCCGEVFGEEVGELSIICVADHF